MLLEDFKKCTLGESGWNFRRPFHVLKKYGSNQNVALPCVEVHVSKLGVVQQ